MDSISCSRIVFLALSLYWVNLRAIFCFQFQPVWNRTQDLVMVSWSAGEPEHYCHVYIIFWTQYNCINNKSPIHTEWVSLNINKYLTEQLLMPKLQKQHVTEFTIVIRTLPSLALGLWIFVLQLQHTKLEIHSKWCH